MIHCNRVFFPFNIGIWYCIEYPYLSLTRMWVFSLARSNIPQLFPTHQYVIRLEISVDEFPLVHVLKALADLCCKVLETLKGAVVDVGTKLTSGKTTAG